MKLFPGRSTWPVEPPPGRQVTLKPPKLATAGMWSDRLPAPVSARRMRRMGKDPDGDAGADRAPREAPRGIPETEEDRHACQHR